MVLEVRRLVLGYSITVMTSLETQMCKPLGRVRTSRASRIICRENLLQRFRGCACQDLCSGQRRDHGDIITLQNVRLKPYPR